MVLTLLLMAAAATVVTGDFDRDGVLDQAFVRSAGGQRQVVISGQKGETIVYTARGELPPYVAKLPPGTYATACAKGLGSRKIPCDPRSITVVGDTLEFGTPESSQAAVLWSDGHYRVVWLSG
jgi:hypothetical protein